MWEKVAAFFRKDVVFSAAALLAVLSALLTPPSRAYLSYMDFRVLALLFCLMLVTAGFRAAGLFESLMRALLAALGSSRQLACALVFSCFFASMFVTNDVALLTFVPFALLVLKKTGAQRTLIPVVVLQTVAANLGSMCTPVGNPQNLYLYMVSGMGLAEFVKLLLPYTLISLLLLAASLCLIPDERLSAASLELEPGGAKYPGWKLAAFCCLFALCMAAVLRLADYRLVFLVVAGSVFCVERKLFAKADYVLLLTFAAFFIFVGNVKNIPAVNEFLVSRTSGHEFLVALTASQFISNVPAAVLLARFTHGWQGLMLGTDLGGLGTLVASMASLISYKFYCSADGADRGRYLAVFTAVNLAYLAVLVAAAWLLCGFR